jgi:hypothetical protein
MKRKAKKANHPRKERTLTEAELKQISAGFHFNEDGKFTGMDIEFDEAGDKITGLTSRREKTL